MLALGGDLPALTATRLDAPGACFLTMEEPA